MDLGGTKRPSSTVHTHRAVILNRDRRHSLLPIPQAFGDAWRHFWLSQLPGEGECYWYLMCRVWRCLQSSYDAQDRAHNKGLFSPKCQQCQIEKLCFTGKRTGPAGMGAFGFEKWPQMGFHVSGMTYSLGTCAAFSALFR